MHLLDWTLIAGGMPTGRHRRGLAICLRAGLAPWLERNMAWPNGRPGITERAR